MANDPNDKVLEIRGMRFPPVFSKLWADGKWTQPEHSLVTSLIPWLQGPIEFIETMDWMVTENRGTLADHPHSSKLFREYRGSASAGNMDLPWLDVDKSLFIAVNRVHGDDLGVAIDFRTSAVDPRVVASYWQNRNNNIASQVEWRLVTETFTEFLLQLNLMNSNEIAT